MWLPVTSCSNASTIATYMIDTLNLTLIFFLIYTAPNPPRNLSLVVAQDASCENNTRNVTIKWMVSLCDLTGSVASYNYRSVCQNTCKPDRECCKLSALLSW